jgi:hypothetical protein
MLGPEMLGPEMLGPEMLGPEMLGPEMLDSETVRFEACAGFRSSDEDELACACGWVEDDHHEWAGELALDWAARQRRRPRPVSLPERRAS